jgi:hypothetical protein
MTTIYTVLEVGALLMVIVLPMRGPRKKKNKQNAPVEMSDWAVNEGGFLESLSKNDHGHHHTVK